MKLHMNILVCEEFKNDLLKTSLMGVADIIRCERGDEVRRMLFLPYVCLLDKDDPRTLYLSVYLRYLADLRGNRPGFSYAAAPDEGKRLYDYFTSRIAAEGIATANGIFGADMDVDLLNQGPVTIWMDTDSL